MQDRIRSKGGVRGSGTGKGWPFWGLLIGAVLSALGGCGDGFDYNYKSGIQPFRVGAVEAVSGADEITADGEDSTVVRATVETGQGDPIKGQEVTFETTAGDFEGGGDNPDQVTVETRSDGVAEASLLAGSSLKTAVVEVSASGFKGQTTVHFTAGPPATISLTPAPATVAPGESVNLTARVTDTNDNRVEGESIRFVTATNNSGGAFESSTVTTDQEGRAEVVYSAGETTATDTLQAVATRADEVSQSVDVSVSSDAATVGSLNVTAVNEEIVADGSSQVAVRAEVQNRDGESLPGIPVSLSTTEGSLDSTSVTTDATGVAEATLTAGNSMGIARINASTAGFTATTEVGLVAGPPDPANSTLSASPQTLPADGSSTTEVTVTLADSQNHPVAEGTEVFLQALEGRVTSDNPATTQNGRATFTLQAPTEQGQADLQLRRLSGVSTQVTFGATGTGEPANISLEVGDPQLFVNGVGERARTDFTVQVEDDTGSAIADPSHNNLKLELLTCPGGDEFISGSDVDGNSVQAGCGETMRLATSNGTASANIQAGTLPGVIEAEVEVVDANGNSLSPPLTASLPQITIASGPPHSINLTTPETDAITNAGGGVYRSLGKVLVSDRYGNPVPDGTTVQLGVIDSVISQDGDGKIAAGGDSLTDDDGTDSSGDAFDGASVLRNGVTRNIEANDRVLLLDGFAKDKSRFVANRASPLPVTKSYNNTKTGIAYRVGAALLGAQMLGDDATQEGEERLSGRAVTQGGQARIWLQYPANPEKILVGCGKMPSRDKRGGRTANGSADVYVVAESSNRNATTVSGDQFCFNAIAPTTLSVTPQQMDGNGVITAQLEDANRIALPYQTISTSVVATTDSNTPLAVDPDNSNCDKPKEPARGDGDCTVKITGADTSGDEGTVTFSYGGASATVDVAVP